MTTAEAGRLGIGLLALWFVAQAISAVATTLSWAIHPELFASNNFVEFAVASVPAIVHLLIAAALLRFRSSLAAALSDSPSASPAHPELDSLAFAAVGAYLAAMAVVWFVQTEISALTLRLPSDLQGLADSSTSQRRGARAGQLVQFSLGSALFLRAPGIAKVWRRVRSAGHKG
jgi:hypothetical protein